MTVRVAFNTQQDIEFLKWLKNTDHTATMLDVDCGWDPDYATGVYYAWFTWELEESALEEYIHGAHTSTQFEWEQLDLELDTTLCNIPRTVRFP